MYSLKNKVVVLTGAAGGLGDALARQLFAHNCRLALLDLPGERLEALREEINADAECYPCDVTNLEQCRDVLSQVRERFGRIDILINNAGITHRSLLHETDMAVIRKVIEVNLLGSIHCTHAALPSLIESQGMIVVVSSVAGFTPLIGRCGYAASKHGLHGFFDTLREEVRGQGVKVLVACPSYVETGLDRRALDGQGSMLNRDKATIGKVMTPDFVAGEILRAIMKQRERLILSPVGKVSYWLSRLAPRLYASLMRRSVEGEFTLKK